MDLVSFTRVLLPASWALFALVAMVLPIVRLRRRTGVFAVTTLRTRDRAEVALGVGLFVCLGGAAALAGLYAALGADRLGVARAPAAVAVAGVACLGLGIGVVVLAQAQMGASWRIGIEEKETGLVTHGLFALVRNPIYSGMLLVVLGEALVAPCAATAGAALGSALFLDLQTRREERHLLARHGEDYRRWAARVGRFVPGLGRIRRICGGP